MNNFVIKLFAAVLTFLTLSLSATGSVLAGNANVLAVEVTKTGAGTYTFAATVRHDDAGWDHYADRWEVLAPDGTVLATRALGHPHVDEQPFTRSLEGVVIPENITRVRVRAHDKVHGFGGLEKEVTLPR